MVCRTHYYDYFHELTWADLHGSFPKNMEHVCSPDMRNHYSVVVMGHLPLQAERLIIGRYAQLFPALLTTTVIAALSFEFVHSLGLSEWNEESPIPVSSD